MGRIFFSKTPKELEELSQMNVKMSSLDKLECKAFAKVKSGIEHQLKSMNFFTSPDDVSAENLKLIQTSNVLTNSGCEGQLLILTT